MAFSSTFIIYLMSKIVRLSDLLFATGRRAGLLLWLLLGSISAWASNGPAAPSLASALNPDGTVRAGASGSFDARQFTMSLAPDGRPAFRPASAKRTSGVGDGRWQDGNGIPGTNGSINVAVVAANGDLYVGGSFTIAGATVANRVARWNGTAWSGLGTGLDGVVYDLVLSGSDVYVAGNFTTAGGSAAKSVARWNGSTWSSLGTGTANGVSGGYVAALAVNGSNVYVGGLFTSAGGSPASRVARWDGSAWNTLGTGAAEGVNNSVGALAISSTGTLYVGGQFTQAGGATANYIASWDGSSWGTLAGGVGGTGFRNIQALGIGPADQLYASGYFTTIGGVSAAYAAQWNGTAWSALGTGMSSPATRLSVAASGEVFMVGSFTAAGGTARPGLAWPSGPGAAGRAWARPWWGPTSWPWPPAPARCSWAATLSRPTASPPIALSLSTARPGTRWAAASR